MKEIICNSCQTAAWKQGGFHLSFCKLSAYSFRKLYTDPDPDVSWKKK